ncbi:unknown [Prevotella sp. CAG:279]|nr:unknown [Prevotella sp. CAG:279]
MFPNTPLPTGFGSSSSIRFSASSLSDSASAVFSSAFLSASTRASSSAFSAAILSASALAASSLRDFSPTMAFQASTVLCASAAAASFSLIDRNNSSGVSPFSFSAFAAFSLAIVSVLLCVNTLTYDFGQYPKHCKMHILALADCLLQQEVVCQQFYIHLMSTILAILTKKHLCGCFFQ